jgi:hypothetical protein
MCRSLGNELEGVGKTPECIGIFRIYHKYFHENTPSFKTEGLIKGPKTLESGCRDIL